MGGHNESLRYSPTIPNFKDLICSVHQEPTIKKRLPFELICAVYLQYIVNFNFF